MPPLAVILTLPLLCPQVDVVDVAFALMAVGSVTDCDAVAVQLLLSVIVIV